MEISLSDAIALFTKQIVAKYADNTATTTEFGRSYFVETATTTKLLSYVTQRGLKLLAQDLERGSRGNLNVFDKITENLKRPPYYNEMINLTEMDSYDRVTVDGIESEVAWGLFIDEIAKKMVAIMNNIDRAYEYQCWQVLLTGMVTMANGMKIKYGRLAASIVAMGTDWTSDSVDPWTAIDRGATHLNETGKISGNSIDLILGKNTFFAYQNNKFTKERNIQWKPVLEYLEPARRDSKGKTYHGTSSIGQFNYNLFSNADFFEIINDDNTVTKTKFMPANQILMLPSNTYNTLTYAGVPTKLQQGQKPVASKFHLYRAEDQFGDGEYIGIKSAGLAIPEAIDQAYVETVITTGP